MTITNGVPWLGYNPEQVPVSNSEISTFKECKRKWWLQYYRGLTSKAKNLTGPLPLGTRIHLALECFYKAGQDPVEAYMEQLKLDRELFDASNDALNSIKRDEFESEAELGRIMIEGYLEWVTESSADTRYDFLDAEKELNAPLMNGRVILKGKIDQRVRDKIDDAILLMDHKTAVQFSMYHNTAHMSEQIMTYILLERLQEKVSGGRVIEGGVYNLLKKVKRTGKAKPPFYDRIVVRFSEKTLESFWVRLHGTLEDMLRVRDELDKGIDHRFVAYPTPTKDCVWKCPFYAACPMFDDGSSVERWLDTFMEQTNPYSRYTGDNEETDKG